MPDGSSDGSRDNYRNSFFFGAFYFHVLLDFANNAYPMHLLYCVHLTKKDLLEKTGRYGHVQ
jgi:hypothetical protein